MTRLPWLLFFFAVFLWFSPTALVAGDDLPACSTTGPEPPPGVEPPKTVYDRRAIVDETEIAGVPAYDWRHGCGPTALGMVVGYWDGHGYPEMYPGDAATQTAAIDQLIASGGEINAPNPAGSEGNCEDYGLPRDDNAGPLLEDAYLTAGRAAHADNCIADWMLTSRSDAACGASPGMRYGWSCSNAICPAFIDYVASRSSTYFATTNDHRWMDAGIDWDDNWDVLKAEIDAGRPMVFLVDSSGDGSTDHFVAIVGYRLNNGQREYGCKDTWNQATRWERFREMSNAYSWGIGYAFTFSLRSGDGDGKWYVNAAYAGVEEGSLARPFNTLGEAVFAAAEGDVIYVKDGLVDYTTLVEKSVLLLKY